MADTQSGISLGRRSGKKKTTVLGLVFAVLIGGYTMFRPAINQATGWNLPAISNRDARPNQDERVAQKPDKSSDQSDRSTSQASQIKTPEVFTTNQNTQKATRSETKLSPKQSSSSKTGTTKPAAKPGPLASRMSPSKSASSPTAKSPGTKTSGTKPSDANASGGDPSLKYGLLQEISRDRFMSPEGLLYTPGSAEGHRLEHLKRHTVDQPTRPGKHGVFDGGMEGALKSIEKAYEKAKAGQRTTKQVDGNRTIYTVDMGKRIGFVGGRDGNQKRKPMARRLRMVLEGNRVITAFPL